VIREFRLEGEGCVTWWRGRYRPTKYKMQGQPAPRYRVSFYDASASHTAQKWWWFLVSGGKFENSI
jgi:hypothetical protein